MILEKQEKSVNACALFYGMCQNPNCVGRPHIIELCSGRCPQAYGQYDGPACQGVYGKDGHKGYPVYHRPSS